MSELQNYIHSNALDDVKLHLGCGGDNWQNYINVDLHPFSDNIPDSSRAGCTADVYADIRHLGLANESVDEIFSAHVVEHFYRWEAIEMLTDWHRILKKDGILVTEMPDFVRCVLWLFHYKKKKRNAAITQFYGNQWDKLEYETHKYLWSAREFVRVLREIGFSSIKVSHRPKTHIKWRDMRVVAVK